MYCCAGGTQFSFGGMKDREPTVRSRELGEGLRRAMEYAGFNASSLARELDWSPGRVSRLLAGKRGGSGYDVTAVVTACGVKGAERDRLMSLALDNDRPGWHQQHGRTLPKQIRTLIDHEKHATAITSYEALLIPGLLQTGEYARAVMRASANFPVEEIEERVEARLSRQGVISRDYPPQLTFFIHEFALLLSVGGPAVMSDQLHSLMRWGVRPHLTIRIVPASSGAHASLAGHFALLEVKNFKPVVYLDSETSSLFLETPIEIDAYRNVVAALDRTALDEGQSKRLIETIAVERYGEDQDDSG